MHAKIGFIGLTLDLYQERYPELVAELAGFSQELAGVLQAYGDVHAAHALYSRADVERAIDDLDNADVDIIVLVLLSYSPSLITLSALLRTTKPVLIWNTQRVHAVDDCFGPAEISANHGMHGVQDLCSVLVRHGRPFHLVTGHYRDPQSLREVEAFIRAASAVAQVRGKRIGIIGHTFDGMGDLAVDLSLLLARTGVEVCHVSAASLAERIASASDEAVAEGVARDREQFVVDRAVTEEAHALSARVELGVRDVVAEERLSAVCPLFYAATDHPGIPTLPFLAVSKLLAEGYGYGGEGDPTSAAAVLLMQALTPDTNFTEMFTIDFAGNSIFMNHMAETNYRLSRPDVPPRLVLNDAAFLPGRPPVCVFAVQRPGIATLLNLVGGPGGTLKAICALGEVEDFGPVPGVLTPHCKWKPHSADGVGSFLTRYSLEGGSHHLALGYGDLRMELRAASAMMGLDYVEVTDP